VGRLKQSDRIVLRVEPEGRGLPFQLLYEAGYNRYRNGLWMASRPGFQAVRPGEGEDVWVLRPGAEERAAVRVSKSLDKGQGVLSLPHGAVA
jgi:hypothetical protein